NFVGAIKSGNNVTINNTVGGGQYGITAAYVANGCKLGNGIVHTTCGSADNVYAKTIGTTPPAAVSAPSVDWSGWYAAGSPGPSFPCVASRSSGTTPTFDNDTTRNDSVPTAWNLTPTSSYDCWTD